MKTAEQKKDFELRFCFHKQIAKDKWEADYSRPIDLPAKYVWQWIEQKVDEACKKQREICAENLRQMCSPNNIGNERLIDTVLNAPSPKESNNE